MKVYRVLPTWAPMAGICVAGRVFVKRTASQVLVDHELVHVEQQRRDGWRFYWRYATSPAWRVRYEAEAYVVQFRAGYDLEVLARQLAGPLYLWPCSVATARQELIEALAAAGRRP